MTSKIRIRVGAVELDYEGPESYLTEHLREMLREVVDLSKSLPEAQPPAGTDHAGPSHDGRSAPRSVKRGLSTRTIAAKMNATSGGDVAKAAAAYLTLVEGKEEFSRSELLAEMKKATGLYKATFNNNLSSTLNRLCNGDVLRSASANRFTLGPKGQTELGPIVAQL